VNTGRVYAVERGDGSLHHILCSTSWSRKGTHE
jgi:hypothetical protein